MIKEVKDDRKIFDQIDTGSAIKREIADTKWENLEIPKVTNLLP